MKIAHVNMFYLPTYGGVEKVMEELAVRQSKKHEVHVYCCDSDKYQRIKKKEETIEGIKVHRLPYLFRLSLNTFIWPSLFFRLLKDQKYDVIHTHVSGHLYILLVGLVCKIKGSKHVHTTHCSWTDAFRPFILKPFVFLNDLIFNKLSFKLVDKVVALSGWEMPILEGYIKNKKKIVIIPNGVDKILFDKVKENKFKKKYKLRDKLVLFFGRLNPTKGPEKLAEAAIGISKERKDIDFLWVGPDEGKAKEVRNLIRGHKNMKYIGPIQGKKTIAEMYQSASVYVLPSYREGLPLTLFEGMASRLPIIASPVNGIPYAMTKENGIFVNYGDIKGLKSAILKILDDKNLAKRYSDNNFKKAQEYTWDNIEKRYMDEYLN
ncbi:MAG: glycosyltransferase family 4 protein [Nanoarchaeota archaeon]|nr:glycosyltransferase family 4 protein [Nanoarchaeota archaeon]